MLFGLLVVVLESLLQEVLAQWIWVSVGVEQQCNQVGCLSLVQAGLVQALVLLQVGLAQVLSLVQAGLVQAGLVQALPTQPKDHHWRNMPVLDL